jgi:hypothetical protein
LNVSRYFVVRQLNQRLNTKKNAKQPRQDLGPCLAEGAEPRSRLRPRGWPIRRQKSAFFSRRKPLFFRQKSPLFRQKNDIFTPKYIYPQKRVFFAEIHVFPPPKGPLGIPLKGISPGSAGGPTHQSAWRADSFQSAGNPNRFPLVSLFSRRELQRTGRRGCGGA